MDAKLNVLGETLASCSEGPSRKGMKRPHGMDLRLRPDYTTGVNLSPALLCSRREVEVNPGNVLVSLSGMVETPRL